LLNNLPIKNTLVDYGDYLEMTMLGRDKIKFDEQDLNLAEAYT